MRVFLSILILIFSFQSFTKADNIRDFEIDGISIGDSLLDHYEITEIKKSENNPTYYPKSKKFKIIFFVSKKNELFDYLNITFKDNDKRYIVHSIRGEKEINIEKCFKMKNNQIEGIESILSKIDKNSYKSYYGKHYGNSEAHVTEYNLNGGAQIRIFCANYDEKNKLVQDNVWKDSLEIGLSSREFIKFLTHEAY